MFLEVDTLALTSGGLEILFSNKRRHDISIPASMDSGKRPNITYLLRHLVDNVIKDERKELFVLDGHLYVDVTTLSTS
jgi:ubiquitin related modifier 1